MQQGIYKVSKRYYVGRLGLVAGLPAEGIVGSGGRGGANKLSSSSTSDPRGSDSAGIREELDFLGLDAVGVARFGKTLARRDGVADARWGD